MSNEDIQPPLHPDQTPENQKVLNIVAEPVEEVEIEEEQEDNNHLSSVQAILLVNFNLASRDIFNNSKPLKTVNIKGETYNAYNPLQKENAEKGLKKGIAYDTVNKAFEYIGQINSNRVVFLGDDTQVYAQLESILGKLIKGVEACLPCASNEQVGTVTYSEEGSDESMQLAISMRDIVRVTGWINYDESPDSKKVFNPYNLVLALTINSGYLYKTEDPHKFLTNIQNRLIRLRETSNSKSHILMGVITDPVEYKRKDVRDLIDVLLDEDPAYDYKIYKRTDLHSTGQISGWSPINKDQVDSDLLTREGDVLYVKVL